MKKVLVTGALGFLGCHLIEKLKENYEVIATDVPDAKVPDFLEPLMVENADITYKDSIDAVFEKHKNIDSVIHLAAYANPKGSEENPLFGAYINIQGALNVFESAMFSDVERLVFMSSSAVYGIPKYDVIAEDHPRRPANMYGFSKLVSEQVLSMCKDLDSVILRGANIYGPGQKNLLIPGLMEKIASNEIPYVNDAVRDYVHVDDISDAILSALEYSGPERIYNLGTGKGTKITEIWDIISDLFNERGFVVPEAKKGKLRAEEIRKITLSGDLAKKELGWIPKIDLKQGLTETVDHFIRECD
ncbi:MAG: NAD-dependent epimerase/dehydratase family protein [Candidatus Woesearchaeota archaeon]